MRSYFYFGFFKFCWTLRNPRFPRKSCTAAQANLGDAEQADPSLGIQIYRKRDFSSLQKFVNELQQQTSSSKFNNEKDGQLNDGGSACSLLQLAGSSSASPLRERVFLSASLAKGGGGGNADFTGFLYVGFLLTSAWPAWPWVPKVGLWRSAGRPPNGPQ